MKQVGNLAIIVANKPDCMLQIFDNEVTIHTGQGIDRKTVSCNVNDDKSIDRIIAYLNFGTKI